jgi:predicted transcriptional regulator
MDTIPEFARDVLVSVHPDYASKILSGQKTVELRRRFPEVGAAGGMALIYSTSPVRAVVGVARIKQVLKLPVSTIWKEHGDAACISRQDFSGYFLGVRQGFAILFDGVWPLTKQINAADLFARFGIVPPQSYRYVTGECVALLSNEQFQAADRHERGNRPRRRPTRSGVAL